jgi:hypothetical protein
MRVPYFSPSELFYRGEVSRERARQMVLENASKTRKITGSPTLNRILKIGSMLILPFVLLAHLVASKRN